MAVTAADIPSTVPKKSGGKLKWLMLILLCSGLAGGGVWYLTRPVAAPPTAAGKRAVPKPQSPPQFISLGPSFIVNLAGDDALRFLQVDVQLMTRNDAVAAAVKQLEPELRNRLLLLFGSQHVADLETRDGKVRLQTQALAEVRDGLRQFNAPSDVDGVIFTSFVMQ